MHLIPHETDNWDDFDLRAALARRLQENHISAEDALCALIQGLVDNHREQRLAYPGEMPLTLLQGVELLLRQQAEHNEAVHDEQAHEDKTDGDWLQGEMLGFLSYQQDAVCDLLCDCIKAVGCAPIREAA